MALVPSLDHARGCVSLVWLWMQESVASQEPEGATVGGTYPEGQIKKKKAF